MAIPSHLTHSNTGPRLIPEKGCLTCSRARWHRTPSGRIAKVKFGRCNAPLPAVAHLYPKSFITPPPMHRVVIWIYSGENCCAYLHGEGGTLEPHESENAGGR